MNSSVLCKNFIDNNVYKKGLSHFGNKVQDATKYTDDDIYKMFLNNDYEKFIYYAEETLSPELVAKIENIYYPFHSFTGKRNYCMEYLIENNYNISFPVKLGYCLSMKRFSLIKRHLWVKTHLKDINKMFLSENDLYFLYCMAEDGRCIITVFNLLRSHLSIYNDKDFIQTWFKATSGFISVHNSSEFLGYVVSKSNMYPKFIRDKSDFVSWVKSCIHVDFFRGIGAAMDIMIDEPEYVGDHISNIIMKNNGETLDFCIRLYLQYKTEKVTYILDKMKIIDDNKYIDFLDYLIKSLLNMRNLIFPWKKAFLVLYLSRLKEISKLTDSKFDEYMRICIDNKDLASISVLQEEKDEKYTFNHKSIKSLIFKNHKMYKYIKNNFPPRLEKQSCS